MDYDIQAEALRFLDAILPVGAPAAVRSEMLKGFMAEFSEAHLVFTEYVARMEDDDAEAFLAKLRRQLEEFAHSLVDGKSVALPVQVGPPSGPRIGDKPATPVGKRAAQIAGIHVPVLRMADMSMLVFVIGPPPSHPIGFCTNLKVDSALDMLFDFLSRQDSQRLDEAISRWRSDLGEQGEQTETLH